jgi:hypothetical protein
MALGVLEKLTFQGVKPVGAIFHQIGAKWHQGVKPLKCPMQSNGDETGICQTLENDVFATAGAVR